MRVRNAKLEPLRPTLEKYARRLSPVISHPDRDARNQYARKAGFEFPDPPLGAPWHETLEVGDLVMVHSRGSWRQAVVTSTGSAYGEPGSRWIHAALVTHAGGVITASSHRPWDVGRRPVARRVAS